MAAPAEIARLVETFERNKESYRQGGLNETQLRREFLDPFFKALGWDVDNTQGWAEPYKEVIHEDAIRIESSLKAPDYCFRIGGTRKFFVEAKAPSVNVKDAVEPAYQLRRYAWSAKLPLSILTDFEEFAVYDCRVRPDKADKPSKARIIYLEYTDYAERWDEIADIFSRDAVLKGSFDKHAVTEKRKHGTAEVDVAFLAEIESWREALAHNIALRNPGLSNRHLNYAVQITIDRIIFLRICEDRGIERYGELMSLLNGQDVYGRMMGLFRKADDRYNSGLFHFLPEKDRPEGPDELTPEIVVDDKPLKDILHSLYYPDSPYEFSVLPTEILGQVYEQFLGKVITLTAGHHARVEDKPEVKKAGGIFYTPAYIVDYIVKQTVGKLLEGRSVTFYKTKPPKLDRPLRVLDPACGSGSFLLGAYQLLLNWYCRYYTEQTDPREWAATKLPPIRQSGAQGWKLTLAERKRILLEHIFGVDIDTQAVEVTKLSLLLKVLEGEKDLALFHHERALPDLAANIKCGNSLIGPDFYIGKQRTFDEDEYYRVNAFDWHDGFPDIFKEGGFDAVIGNPPYVRIQGFPRDQIDYLTARYRSATGNCDLYVSFVERGFTLLKKDGLFGQILPNKFFRTDYGEGLRSLLSDEKAVTQIVDFGASQVFAATTYTCLLFLRNADSAIFEYSRAQAGVPLPPGPLAKRNTSELGLGAWTFESSETASLLSKVRKGTKRLLDLPAEMSRGSSTGDDEVFVFESGSLNVEEAILRTPLFASDFGRYAFGPTGKWKVIFPYVRTDTTYRLYAEEELRSHFPRVFAYLHENQTVLKRRKQYREWFAYSAPRNLELHDQAQIAVPLLADRGLFTLIPSNLRGHLCPMASGGFTVTVSKDCGLRAEYVLGLLNSRLLFWCLRAMSNVFRGGWITCTKQYFGELPIRTVDLSNARDKVDHDQIVELVEGMLRLHKDLAGAKTPNEKERLQRQIAATDAQIDQLVYELYGLTPDEIKIVEGASQ
jgi:hypothetical protein